MSNPDNNIFIKFLKITFGAFVICTIFTIIITKNDNDARDVSPAKDEGKYSSGTYLPSNDTCIPSIPVSADTFATNTSIIPEDFTPQSVVSAPSGFSPDDAYNEGYNTGYDQGMEDGRKGKGNGYGYDNFSSYDDHYETRYKEGYERGYGDGYYQGKNEYEEENGNID